jgi:hypothetical protein
VSWVHIIMDSIHLPLPSKVVFAVDRDLIVAVKFVSFPIPVFVLTCHTTGLRLVRYCTV